MVESADLGQCNDAPLRRWLDGARLGSILPEREMRCPWPKLDLKGVDHTTGSLQTAADKESQKSAGLRDERSVNGSPV